MIARLAVMALAAVHPSQTADQAPEVAASVRLAEAPDKSYSDDPNDSWIRIFYYLFSLRVAAQLSSEFPEVGPFQKVPEMESMRLEQSTRTFERVEIGDRAIDPMYPSFWRDDGIRTVLKSAAYADFKKALQDLESMAIPAARGDSLTGG